MYRRHASRSRASDPSSTISEAGYHQLVMPSVSGSSPAEIAGAIGDRSAARISIALATVSETEIGP